MTELWKAVPAYEGLYEVSNMGRIRSLPRRVPCVHGSRISPGKILKLSFPGVEYQGVTLFKDGVSKSGGVHRIVLTAFVGPRPAGLEACHWNGNPQDNRLSNLRWDTRKANRADSRRLRTMPLGTERPMSKLNASKVVKIRIARATGVTCRVLSIAFNVSPSTISKVARRDKWRHVA